MVDPIEPCLRGFIVGFATSMIFWGRTVEPPKVPDTPKVGCGRLGAVEIDELVAFLGRGGLRRRRLSPELV